MKRIDVAIAIVINEGRILICRRRSEDRFGGYWEFPGGKVEPGETVDACLTRELREELGVQVGVAEPLPIIEHDYPDVSVRLHPFLCEKLQGAPRPIACEKIEWIEPRALRDYQFPEANADLIQRVMQRLSKPQSIAPKI